MNLPSAIITAREVGHRVVDPGAHTHLTPPPVSGAPEIGGALCPEVSTDSPGGNHGGKSDKDKHPFLIRDYQVDWHTKLMESEGTTHMGDLINYEQDAAGDDVVSQEYTPEYFEGQSPRDEYLDQRDQRWVL